MKVFWFHYNKIVSRKYGKPKITVHYDKKCHIVDNIICNVPTKGHTRKEQPNFVIKGKCSIFVIENNVCKIS